MLELEAVRKSLGASEVIKGVNLRIEPAQTTVLLGPSGCGKSTLLRLMLGLLSPDAGRIRFNGDSVNGASTRSIRHRVGYVIQDGGLFPHLTASGNITLMARQLKWDGARIKDRLEALLTLTKFPRDGLARYPVQLSGGQRQRVALMRALMLDPDVLLLDEPLAALDPMIRYELQNDLRGIFQELSKTTVLVTHDLAEAAYFGDRIVLMREGEIVQQGTLEAMLHSPAEPFVTQFINAQRSHLDAPEDAAT
jgi:osmoprotectant transport system ATP-binding protein